MSSPSIRSGGSDVSDTVVIDSTLSPEGRALIEESLRAQAAEEAWLPWQGDDVWNGLNSEAVYAYEAWFDWASDNEVCLLCGADTSEDGHAYCMNHREES